MPVRNFSHFGLCVSDPERSMRFYCDVLGFTKISKLFVGDANSYKLVDLAPLDSHSYFLERDGMIFEAPLRLTKEQREPRTLGKRTGESSFGWPRPRRLGVAVRDVLSGQSRLLASLMTTPSATQPSNRERTHNDENYGRIRVDRSQILRREWPAAFALDSVASRITGPSL